jgi:RimJ/RimL family protein N-acetyltransferase
MKILGNNNVVLRTIEISDAEFILDLRTNQELSKHLSQVNGSIENQIKFIENYKIRENAKLEYYFIIEYNNKPVGTVRLYNINYEKSTFTWGSWIVQRGNPGEVALSSAYMTYYFGFNKLGLQKAEIDVRKENKSVYKFHKTYCDFLYEDELNYYLEFKKEDFGRFVDRFGIRVSESIDIC